MAAELREVVKDSIVTLLKVTPLKGKFYFVTYQVRLIQQGVT